jgi:bifunctional enzyme CysN/CysC
MSDPPPPPNEPTSPTSPRLIAEDIDAYLDQHQHKTMLRFITCGSVDDGKSTLIGRLLYDSKMIFEDQLAALQADSRRSARRAGNRLRAAGRWPGRRARAGHHHRRRLPLLQHRKAQVHRRRHARPRTVHPQHGHRRLDRRPRGDPDRRAQGRADPDPPPQLPVPPDRHQATSCWRSTRWTWSTTDQEVFDRSSPTTPSSPKSIGIESFTADADLGLQGRQHHRPSANTPWYTARPGRASGDGRSRSARDQAKPFRMPVQWVNRPNLDFRGFSGLIATGFRSSRAMRCACCPRARPARSPASSPGRRPGRGRRRPVGDAASPTRSTARAAT